MCQPMRIYKNNIQAVQFEVECRWPNFGVCALVCCGSAAAARYAADTLADTSAADWYSFRCSARVSPAQMNVELRSAGNNDLND